MTAPSVNTPHYVLLEGKHRLGPALFPADAGSDGAAIFGFSDKPPYDLFCANTEIELTPYPLVKGYLKNQVTDFGDAVQLVIVDAAGPNEALLNAATMKSVLEAQEQESERVTISFHLTLDQESQTYRIERALSDSDPTSRPAEPRSV